MASNGLLCVLLSVAAFHFFELQRGRAMRSNIFIEIIVRALCRVFLLSSLNVPLLWVDLENGASTPSLGCVTAKYPHVYAWNLTTLSGSFPLLSSKLIFKCSYKCEGLNTVSLSVFLTSAVSTGDTASTSIYLALVVSLTALVVLVVLLVNCVTCCKEREINFKVRGSWGR